jgi:hypothetical protein
MEANPFVIPVVFALLAVALVAICYPFIRLLFRLERRKKQRAQEWAAAKAGCASKTMKASIYRTQWMLHIYDQGEAVCVHPTLHHHQITLPSGEVIERIGIVEIEDARQALKDLGVPTTPPEVRGQTATILPFPAA